MKTLTQQRASTKHLKAVAALAQATNALSQGRDDIQYALSVVAEWERSGNTDFDVFCARRGMQWLNARSGMKLEHKSMLMNLDADAPWQVVEVLNASAQSCAGCQQRRCPAGCPNY